MKSSARHALLGVLLFAAACGGDDGPTEPAVEEDEEAGTSYASISTGRSHTCALTTDGVAHCWGDNDFGQLGDGTQTDAAAPVTVLGGHTFAWVGAGSDHTCGLTAAGAAFCWGDNVYGQLGDGSSGSGALSASPVAVVGVPALSSLSAGSQSTCGVDSGGAAFCWGRSAYGALGDSSSVDGVSDPVEVKGGYALASVDRGASHTCAIDTTGEPYCWGMNFRGQLGNPATTQSCSVGSVTSPCATGPLAVAGSLTATSISAGGSHSCMVTAGGGIACWGNNRRGQVGAPTSDSCGVSGNTLDCSPTPLIVAGLSSMQSVSAALASEHSCGLTTGGAAYCWGTNAYGQLGDGTATESGAPVVVGGGLTFAAVSAGGGHTCGVTTDDEAYCWGRNHAGQLGDESTTDRPSPVRIGD